MYVQSMGILRFLLTYLAEESFPLVIYERKQTLKGNNLILHRDIQ